MYKVRYFKAFGICLILQYLQLANVDAKEQIACLDQQFQCKNGDCIRADLKCDTRFDCSDKSDETFEQCYQWECPNRRCSYGACFDDSQFCDGKMDCWDGTDEFKFHCVTDEEKEELYKNAIRGECKHETFTQFQCQQSKQCISYNQICDGVEHCRDKSDESDELCVGSVCPEGSFRCAYGACIAETAACNHVIDCRDGSDELTSICKSYNISPNAYWDHSQLEISPAIAHSPDYGVPAIVTSPLHEEKSCIVTTDDKALRVSTLFNGLPYHEGNNVSHQSAVHLRCGPKHVLKGSAINTCDNGKWKAPWPECIKVCDRSKITNDPSINAVCSYEGRIIDCAKKPLIVNTIAEIKCAQGYIPERAGPRSERICNSNGKWEHLNASELRGFKCKPDCGKICSTCEGFPWLVSIYHQTSNSNVDFSCQGAIVDPFYVLTTASCFPPSPVSHTALVVLGNHSVGFNLEQEHGFDISNIANIEVEEFKPFALLKMVNPFILSAKVRPVCMKDFSGNLSQKHVESWRYLGEPLVQLDSQQNVYALTHVVENDIGISFNLTNILKTEIKQNQLNMN